MEIVQLLTLFLILILPLTLLSLKNHGKQRNKLPPGPWPLPIIGNLHILGTLPHRSLATLAIKYGPIMYLRLGLVPTIVVSSSEAAKLFLKNHDLVFASRPAMQAVKYLWYGGKAIGFTPYGNYWRKARKMCTLQLLTATAVDSFEWLRRAEVEKTVRLMKEAGDMGKVVNVGKKIGELTESIMFKMMVGKGKEEDKRYDLKDSVEQVLALAGAFNMADFVPFLAPLDLQGLTRRMKTLSKVLDKTLEAIIEDHLNEKNFEHHKDLLGVMLTIMKKPSDISLDRENIKAILLDLFGAGIDTIGHTIEWALAALMKEPRVMKLLREELDSVVGKERMVSETDFARLPYLDMVIKETLRLYPGGPLLLPRESMEDIVLNGYLIPKKSRIIVNMWAIARDPKDWSDNAYEFYPERFKNGIDGGGQHFEYIPFGAGRRGCPGGYLGTITAKIALARLVHCFDWELPKGVRPEDLDMTERFGISIPRVAELFATPSYRLKVTCP